MLLNYIASNIEWLFMGEKHRLSSTFFPRLFSLTFSSPLELHSLLVSSSSQPAFYLHISDTFLRFSRRPRETAHAANSEMTLIFLLK